MTEYLITFDPRNTGNFKIFCGDLGGNYQEKGLFRDQVEVQCFESVEGIEVRFNEDLSFYRGECNFKNSFANQLT